MNRAPSPRDPWWSQHQQSCGGTYEKIKEPEDYGKKKKTTKRSKDDNEKKLDKSMNIKDLFKKNEAGSTKGESGVPVSEVKPFEGAGHRLCDSKDRVSNARVDDGLSMRERMLLAAEKRQRESERHRSPAQKRPRDHRGRGSPSHLKKVKAASEDIRNYFSDSHTNSRPAAKRPKLGPDDQVIVLDSADSPKVQDNPIESLSNFTTPAESELNLIIDLSQEAAGPSSSAVLVLDQTEMNDSVREVINLDDPADYVGTDDDDDLVEIASGSGSPTMTSTGDLDFKTCPVCGMSNIPQAIINTHIAYCFDAEEESQLVDEDNL